MSERERERERERVHEKKQVNEKSFPLLSLLYALKICIHIFASRLHTQLQTISLDSTTIIVPLLDSFSQDRHTPTQSKQKHFVFEFECLCMCVCVN